MEANLTDAFGLLGLVALVYAFINFLRNVASLGSSAARNSVVTMLAVWGGGVLALFLAAQADIADTIPIFGTPLGELDAASLIIAGLSLGSAASAGNDFLASRDGARSSANPHLLGESVEVVEQPTRTVVVEKSP